MTPGPGLSMRLERNPEPIPILYIDDDPEDSKLLEDQLAPQVVNPVLCFTNARDLYHYLDLNQAPFIILVDLVLFNNMDSIGGGYEILSNLRRRPDLNDSRSPILAVTGTNPDATLIERVRKTGADAFIHKPVRVDDLVTAIGRPGWFRVELSR